MTIIEVAQIYTELVRLESNIPEEQIQAKDQSQALRTKYHEILMAKMREEGVDFQTVSMQPIRLLNSFNK